MWLRCDSSYVWFDVPVKLFQSAYQVMAFIADKSCMLLLFRGISLWMSLREASGRFVNLNSENCTNFAYMQFWTIEIKGSKATSEHIIHNEGKETAAKSPDEQHSKQLLSWEDQNLPWRRKFLSSEEENIKGLVRDQSQVEQYGWTGSSHKRIEEWSSCD